MEIDTPPHETISNAEQKFEDMRRRSGFFLAPAGFFITWWLAAPVLAPEAARLSAVLVMMVLFWLTESIPLPVTALLGEVMCRPQRDCQSPKTESVEDEGWRGGSKEMNHGSHQGKSFPQFPPPKTRKQGKKGKSVSFDEMA